jgi:hypothetical protein
MNNNPAHGEKLTVPDGEKRNARQNTVATGSIAFAVAGACHFDVSGA